MELPNADMMTGAVSATWALAGTNVGSTYAAAMRIDHMAWVYGLA